MTQPQRNQVPPPDMDQMVERIQGSLAGAATVLMTHLGDRLGLYQNLTDQGPATASELAHRTGYAERYLAEWLAQQTSVGFLSLDPTTGQYTLPETQAMLLSSDETPATFMGGFEAVSGFFADLDTVADAFRTGEGIDWGDHDQRLYRGTARFFGAAYRMSLVDDWIPALGLNGVLEAGARVADVGCGHGVSTVLMARAFPQSTFVGFDSHRPSVEAARRRAVEAGVEDRVSFVAGAAESFDGGPYDVVWFFDVIHDLGDPIKAAAHALTQLSEGGMLAVVEPFALDDPAENQSANPVSVLHYAASTFLCVPHSLSQPGQAAIGGQAGGRVLADLLHSAGYRDVDQVATTPVHAVYAAHP